jgi:hypothetical protein
LIILDKFKNVFMYLYFRSSMASITIVRSFSSNAENIKANIILFTILSLYSGFLGITLDLKSPFLLKSPKTSALTDERPY